MTAVATQSPSHGDADEQMITSPDDLIDHFARVVHRLDKAEAFSRVTEVGPLRIQLNCTVPTRLIFLTRSRWFDGPALRKRRQVAQSA